MGYIFFWECYLSALMIEWDVSIINPFTMLSSPFDQPRILFFLSCSGQRSDSNVTQNCPMPNEMAVQMDHLL